MTATGLKFYFTAVHGNEQQNHGSSFIVGYICLLNPEREAIKSLK